MSKPKHMWTAQKSNNCTPKYDKLDEINEFLEKYNLELTQEPENMNSLISFK